jgi:membrane-bound lytic murein transglycosylase D
MALTECTNSGEYTADKTGMFRINMETARKHNVLVSRYVDKRRDPITSAEVVAKELSNHYMEYANWKDAVLAFLSGVERFDTYKSNTSTGLAELNNYYKFVAASYLAFFHESHRIFASNKLPEKTRKVPIEKLTTLYQLATNLNVDYEVMKELNAVYVKEIVPSKSATVVTIPEDRSEKFKALGAGIYNYANIEVFTATEIKLAGDLPQLRIEKGDSILDETGTELIYHVRKDDILIKVADYFDCDVVQIKRWNNLKDDYLDIDQPLIIKVPREKFKYYSRVDLMTRKERKKHAAKD